MILFESNARAYIPHDPDIYARQNLVERFFCKMKYRPKSTTIYEKLKRNYLSMVHIFAIRCRLNCVHTVVTACSDERVLTS